MNDPTDPGPPLLPETRPSLEEPQTSTQVPWTPDATPGVRAASPAMSAPKDFPVRQPGSDASSEILFLEEQFERKQRECAGLGRSVQELRMELGVLRRDFSAQQSENLIEVRTLKAILKRTHDQAATLQAESTELKQGNKQLKAQNLDLQYHLNAWGIPVSVDEEGSDPAGYEASDSSGAFFPILTPLVGGTDPIQVVLRGDLATFYFPNVLHFLANSRLQGVLTVVSDGIASKLYLEKSVLRLAAWNNRDPDLRFATLLQESQLVPPDIMAEFEGHDFFDLDLATLLVTRKKVAPATVQSGLKEHARVILGFLFHLKRGTFLFQPGEIPRKKDLQFQLHITNLLLKTAAEMDERTRGPGGLAKTEA